ncbi:MAG TPA: hemerythrin domain-containing protein [Planctomycetota bacterium]
MADTKIRVRKATALLKEDHQNVKKLFLSYERADEEEEGQKASIFDTLRKEIEVHAQIEEEIFYPAIQTSDDSEAGHLLREAAEEHRLIKQLLQELEPLTPGDEDFDAKLKVLKDNVLHHAEEEQEQIFPIFDALPRDDRDEVAERLSIRKRELTGEE